MGSRKIIDHNLTNRLAPRRKIQSQGIRFSLFILCLASTLLIIGCGEKENKYLVSARSLIQQGKYKEAQEITALKNDLQAVLKEEAENPEALCCLKALEIIQSGASAETQVAAIEKIFSLIKPIENEINELEAKDKDLMTDDDKDRLEKLNRKWNLSLEPAIIILKSQTGWVKSAGIRAIDLLIESLKVKNPMVQKDVVDLLVELKDQSFIALINALQNENAVVRRQALIALGKIGDDRAIEPITELFSDQDPGVVFYVPVALRLIGGEKIIEPLHMALKNKMSQVRSMAADMLGNIEDETAIDLLIELLADGNSYVKTSATNALAKIGKPAVDELIEVLDKKGENVKLHPSYFIGDKIGNRYKKELAQRADLQSSAATILAQIRDTRAIEPLIRAMKMEADANATEDEKTFAASVRSSASTALGTIGASAVEPLIKVLEDKNESEVARVNAGSILSTIGDDRAVIPLINALSDENKSIRASTASALGALKDRRATLPLIEALSDPDIVTRANAAASLGTLADTRATQALLKVVKDEGEREKIRNTAIESLGLIKDAAALETLIRVLIDEYEKDGTRKSAAMALRTMENSLASEPLIALLKGEIVYGVYMPESGLVSEWLAKEGQGNLVKGITTLYAISVDGSKKQISAPEAGTLIKIYVKDGETAEADKMIGLISYKDKDIKEEERSSIRNVAALALGLVKGENALPALVNALKEDKNAAVRKNSASSLRELDNPKARDALIRALKKDDGGAVRSAAAYALGSGAIKGASTVEPLIEALEDDEFESTRIWAAWGLGEIADKRAIESLIKTIVEGRDKDEPEAPTVIAQAVTALYKIGAPAIEPLVEVLKDKDIDEVPRGRSAHILGLIANAKATETLVEALKDESVVVRSESAKSLGTIGDRRAVELFIEIVNNKNEWVTTHVNAISALGNIKDERAVMPLINTLESDIATIRSNAVVAVGKIKDKRAVTPLIRILENERETDAIRINAISALASIGDKTATDALMRALAGDDIDIRQNAIVALGDLEAREAVDPLIAIVRNMNEPVTMRANSAEALGKIGDKRAIPVLTERIADRNETEAVWIKIAQSAGKLGATQISDWARERIKDTWEPVAVRAAAMMAISGTGNESDISLLLEMLTNATLEIRAGAALALGNSGSRRAVQPLIERLQTDGEEVVRRDSAKALGAIADPASEEALIKAFKEDATASVKNESAIALGKIKGKKGIEALISVLQDESKANDHRWNSAIALGEAGNRETVTALNTALKSNVGNIHFEAAEALRKITGQNYGYVR